MAERKVRQDLLVRGGAVEVREDRGRREQVGVGQHHALGWPGHAGRVDGDGDLVATRPLGHELLPQLEDGPGRFLAEVLELVEADRHGILEPADPPGVDDDDGAQLGELVPDGDGLVELLLVFDDDDPGVRVAQDLRDAGFGLGRVDAHGDGTDALDGEVGEEPLGPVLAQHGDPVAGSDAEMTQAEGDGGGLDRVVTPRDLEPAAEPFDPQGDVPGPGLGLLEEPGREGDGLDGRRGGRVDAHATSSGPGGHGRPAACAGSGCPR